MKKQFSRLAAWMLSCAICSAAFAQSNEAVNAQPTSGGCLFGNFNRNVTALPENFNCAHSVNSVLSGLKKLQYEKDKYESTAQHAERMRQELKKPLYESVSGAGTLAFVVGIKPQYNADKGRFEIAFPTELLSNYKLALRVERRDVGSGAYVGQNAFGVTLPVTTKAHHAVVLFSPGMNVINEYQWVYLKMAPAEARKIDGHVLGLLHIGKIAAPYYATDVATSSASVSSPTQYRTSMDIIGFKLEETWLYDVNTGKILSKKIKVTK